LERLIRFLAGWIQEAEKEKEKKKRREVRGEISASSI
jgi:hypothetical protein